MRDTSRLGRCAGREFEGAEAAYAGRVTGSLAALIALAIPAVVALLVTFLVVYYAVRLAIRHERERDSRRTPPVE